jgi:hypothetical protein
MQASGTNRFARNNAGGLIQTESHTSVNNNNNNNGGSGNGNNGGNGKYLQQQIIKHMSPQIGMSGAGISGMGL